MLNNNPSPDLLIVQRDAWRRRIVEENEATARRLLSAYNGILPDLRRAAGELAADIERLAENVTPEDVRNLSTYERLLLRTRAEMNSFSRILDEEQRQAQTTGIEIGSQAAQSMAEASGGPLVRAAWLQTDPAALERLIGYVDGAAMRENLSSFGENAAQSLADVILAGVAQGKNPRAIAGLMTQWFNVPYSWAENSARTVQLWSYRTATHAAYKANSAVVSGWMWWSARDRNTCVSCWSQHGQRFSNDEVLNDHHRGRCTPLPIVFGTTWADQVVSGPDEFRRLSATEQRAIMGGALWRAWRAGEVDFPDFSRPYQNNVYGEMLREASLYELIGRRATFYYAR